MSPKGVFCSTVCALLCICTLFVWHCVSSGRPSLGAACFAVVFVATSYLFGILIIGLMRIRDSARLHGFTVVLITGGCLVAILCFFIKVIFPIPTILLLPLLLLICLVSIAKMLRTGHAPAFLFSSEPTDILAVLLSSISATLWSRFMLTPFDVQGNIVLFAPWRDYFIHAKQIAIFTGPWSALQLGMFEMAGHDFPFYHYASYLMPASYSAFSNVDTLSAATAIWAPYALFLVGLSAYALANCWWGPAAGFGAFAITRLIPDASYYGLKTAWFGYYWIQTNSPTLTYGLSISAVSLLFVVHGCRASRPNSLILGLCLGACLLFFKAHLFAVVMPLLIIFSLIFFGKLPGALRAAIGIGLYSASVLVLHHVSSLAQAPIISFDGSGLKKYIGLIFRMTENDKYHWLFQGIGPHTPLWSDLLYGAAIITAGTFGVLVIIYVLLLLLGLLRHKSESVDILPALVLLIYLFFALLLAENTRGNPFELHHRPFVWAYFLFAVWVGGRMVRLCADKLKGTRQQPVSRSFLGFMLCALVLLSFLPALYKINAPKWAAKHYNTPIAKGHLEAARFIKQNSSPEDIVQDSQEDPYSITLALSERRAYLARKQNMNRKPARRPIVKQRLEKLHRLKEADSLVAIYELADELRIRWYLLYPMAHVNWPTDFLDKPLFESSGFRVYVFDSNHNGQNK